MKGVTACSNLLRGSSRDCGSSDLAIDRKSIADQLGVVRTSPISSSMILLWSTWDMAYRFSNPSTRLQVEQLESRENPSGYDPLTFDQLTPPKLPSDWANITPSGSNGFTISADRAFSGNQSLASSNPGASSSRVWWNTIIPKDLGVHALIYSGSSSTTQIFLRGQNLSTNSPTYYAASISENEVRFLRSKDGQEATLASVPLNGVSNQWLRVTLSVINDQVRVGVIRLDNGQYLSSVGTWQTDATSAIQLNDGAIAADGFVGVLRPTNQPNASYVDDFGIILKDGSIVAPSSIDPPDRPSSTSRTEKFDTTNTGSIPNGWSRWANDRTTGIAVTSNRFYSAGNGLASSGTSAHTSRAWISDYSAKDVEVSAAIYLDSLIPGQVFARGSNLDTATPTYYSVSVSRGLTVQLLETVSGKTTVLGTLKSSTYFSSNWARVVLTTSSDQIRVQIQRLDNNQWLSPDGTWQSTSTHALQIKDGTISGTGRVGVNRSSSYSGTVVFDNFEARTIASGDTQAPSVSLTIPNDGQLSGTQRISATASDNIGVTRVEFYLNGKLQKTLTSAPYNWDFDTRGLEKGTYTILVWAYDQAGNIGSLSKSVTVDNTVSGKPNIPKHYTHIRIAQLAYSGNPMGSFEQDLLKNSVDLVIPNTQFLNTINQVSPATPQLIYTNVSNLYLDLLTDWLNYADRVKASREDAFYHVSKATAWSGNSPSSQPVNWFWNVSRGANSGSGTFTNLTTAARNSTTGDTSFGTAGQSLYLGYTERFREINLALSKAASADGQFAIEYVSAVDANGNPTQWKTLTLSSNSTQNFRASGQLIFNPPSDWKTALVNGSSARLYYVRIRTISATTVPVATTILGRDYVNAQGKTSGTIPAFDSVADRDGDGYLNDTEYTNRASGKDARFVYESRLFYPYYGQMRFVTNPSTSSYKNWAADYHLRLLNATPLADGLFVDNSGGKLPLDGASVIENTSTYAKDFGSLLGTINNKVSPKWLIANTSGGNANTDQVVAQVPSTLEEFALRPLTTTWSAFLDMSNLVARRFAANPEGYLILDSLPTGGSPTDPRTQIATLSYYYLLADPDKTFLMFYGGYEPGTTWTRHWSQAATYDVGKPLGNWSTLATGADPTNANLVYNIYQREYSNALVLYKPLSYKLGKGTGTTADNTATTHVLNGNYRLLNADGTLGPVVNKVTLRNGEGAILIKA